jgi:predicted amidohydrolase
MQTTRVAAVSMNGFLGQPKRVLAGIAGWCERAVAEKADLVLFPELVVHGQCTPNTWTWASPCRRGPASAA